MAAANAEQQDFGDVAEVKADPASVRPAVLADFVPDDVGLVGKSPRRHHGEALRKQGVRDPQIEMGRLAANLGHGKGHDVCEAEGAIAAEPAVFRCDLPRLVLEAPGRISKDAAELPTAKRVTKRVCRRLRSAIIHS